MMCFEATAVCDTCGYEERCRFQLSETTGVTIFQLPNMQKAVPPGWRFEHKAGKRVLCCPKCVERPILKAV